MWGRQMKGLACLKVKLGVCLYLYIYMCVSVNMCTYMRTYADRRDAM